MTSESSAADTDNDSIECFQNYTASEVFIQGLAGLVDQQDVESMIRAQKQILQRFEKTNEMLSNCNTLSISRLKVANQQLKTYKMLLVDIRKDLDYTFKKINVLKGKLQSQYPESTAASTSKEITLQENKESCGNCSSEPNVAQVKDDTDFHSLADDEKRERQTEQDEHHEPSSEETSGADSYENRSISNSDTT